MSSFVVQCFYTFTTTGCNPHPLSHLIGTTFFTIWYDAFRSALIPVPSFEMNSPLCTRLAAL